MCCESQSRDANVQSSYHDRVVRPRAILYQPAADSHDCFARRRARSRPRPVGGTGLAPPARASGRRRLTSTGGAGRRRTSQRCVETLAMLALAQTLTPVVDLLLPLTCTQPWVCQSSEPAHDCTEPSQIRLSPLLSSSHLSSLLRDRRIACTSCASTPRRSAGTIRVARCSTTTADRSARPARRSGRAPACRTCGARALGRRARRR